MKIEFSVKIEEVNTEEVLDGLRRALYKSMVKMKELAIRNAPVDLGMLRSSINLKPNITNADKYILSDGVSYGVFMEYGTRPHWAPIKPLIEWAKRHGGDEGFGYALQQKIAKVGVSAHPFMRPALYEVQDIWIPFYFGQVGDTSV